MTRGQFHKVIKFIERQIVSICEINPWGSCGENTSQPLNPHTLAILLLHHAGMQLPIEKKEETFRRHNASAERGSNIYIYIFGIILALIFFILFFAEFRGNAEELHALLCPTQIIVVP